MTDPLLALMQRYHSRGVLVDTNILLLYFVGKFKREQVPNFKRTAQFTPEDFDLLFRLLSRFDHIVTTPNVLSEVSNLSAQLGERRRLPIFESLPRESRPWTSITSKVPRPLGSNTSQNWA